jgi:hypothetical protein
MIRVGQAGFGALALPGLLQAQQQTNGMGTGGKAKSVILIYLWGGPPQMDMWDPNPEAPSGIRSLFKPVPTKVPGIHVSEAMPLFAKWTHKTAIIRSLTHDSNEHGNSVYYTLTGHKDKAKVFGRNHRSRKDWPGMGSVLAGLLPIQRIPATITIPRPIGHGGVTYSGTHAGFMGPRHDPLELGRVGEQEGADEPHPLSLPKEVSKTRLLARKGLVQSLEDLGRRLQTDPATAGFTDYREQALDMLLTSKVKDAIDLKNETAKTRERYGRNEWGEAILTAKRLVEAGVRLVTISWMYISPEGIVANVWDNHGGKIITGYEMLKNDYCLPSLELGFNALMEDLTASDLLEETLVAMYGEFGRTPKINENNGRDHWGALQSAVLAGGGIQGGQVYGKSDKQSAYPTDRPVAPEDLHATMYHALGIPPDTVVYDQFNAPHRICDGRPLTTLF